MKINYQQLAPNLKRSLSSIYLLTGDDFFLVKEAINTIITHAQSQGFTDTQRLYVEPSFDWHDFYSEVNNLSLFCEQKIIELYLHATINDIGSKTLIKYAENPNKNNLLLIVAEKLDANTQKKAWYKAIEKFGTVVQVWPLDVAQLPAWILHRAKEMGLQIEPAFATIIADFCNGNLFAAAQEIEKLLLIFGTKKFTSEELLASITDNSRYSVFNLVDQTFIGNTKQIVNILTKLENEGTEPTIVLWAITRELRPLIRMAHALKFGKNIEQVLTQENVWPSRKAVIKNILTKLSLQNFEKCLTDSFQIDLIIKGAKTGNVWTEFTKICLALANVNVI